MKTKEMKGITLVALVVTIVVLLILAGVSINAVLGDNGIIKKANQAASITKEAEVKEAINRTILEFYLTNDYETLEDFLKAKAEDGSIDSVTKNADGTLTVKKGEYSVTVENKTNSSGGSSSGGSTGGETQTPEITIGEAKVVANSDGTGSAITDANSVYLGNTLYITFSHSITGGTTTVDKTIPYAVTKNGTYKFTVTGTVNGTAYTKEVSVEVNQFKDTYEYMDKNTEVTYPDGKVWVPEGFKIADDSSDNIQGGVVIEDKDGNQFVWVPVDKIDDYKRTAYAGDVATETIDSTTNSIKISSGRYYYTEALPDDEKNSVTTYKGFYIGRYEAGDKESTGTTKATFRTGGLGTSNSVTIKADQVPYDHVTRDEAVSLAEGFKKQQNYNDTLTTKLVSSYAWDTTIAFMQKTENEYGESSPQGNYKDTTFTYKDITDENKTEQIKDEDSELLVATGQTTPVCNIYDMGGNVYEWTSEVTSKVIPNSIQYYYTHRGSCYQNNYVSSAGTRMFSSGIVISQHRLQNCFIFVDKCNSCSKQG
jgi:formylglycine-generating enzyme required for sulfatase activity/Tfp pilus assembly protein PilE